MEVGPLDGKARHRRDGAIVTAENVRFRVARADPSRGADSDIILVAASSRGVLRVDIDVDERLLRERLSAWSRTRLPGVAPRELAREDESGGDPTIDAAVHAVRVALGTRESRESRDSSATGRSAAEGIPLDERGTALQLLVWRALRAIPAGSTASYAELAKAVGKPRAARAVANACGANPIAILVPCHRAVRSDGSLGGYRWGIGLKKAILALEAANAARATARGTRPVKS